MITENEPLRYIFTAIILRKIYEKTAHLCGLGGYAASCAAKKVFKNCIFYPAEY